MSATMFKSDAQVQRDVLNELEWDPRVDPTEVGVQVEDGVVTLAGSVDSYAKKIAAKEAAHRVGGVHDVVNNLTVVLGPTAERTDQNIARAVRRALEWDVFVPEERIHSTVSNGSVTLEGEVDLWTQLYDAERAVERLTGVKGVCNLITVRPPIRVNPEKLRDEIEKALDRQIHREVDRLEIDVQDGVVTLTGSVRSWAERNAIHNLVQFAPGVCRVEDRLSIHG